MDVYSYHYDTGDGPTLQQHLCVRTHVFGYHKHTQESTKTAIVVEMIYYRYNDNGEKITQLEIPYRHPGRIVV